MTEIDNGRHRTIEVGTALPSASRWTTITLTNTISGDFIVAGLDPAQRKALADALDPEPSRGVETGYALQVDALTRERDQLKGMIEALTAARDGFRDAYDKAFNRSRKANARADAAEAKVRELEQQAGGIRVSEEDIAAFTVERSEDGRWFADDKYSGHENETPEGKREQRDVTLRLAAKHEAVARAIEAEQATDRVEALADKFADILYGDELVTDQMRGVLERVVRAGMLLPEQDSDR